MVNADSCLEITGIDRMTLPPTIIETLDKSYKKAIVSLSLEMASSMNIPKINVDEKSFRWLVYQNEIGNEKLEEGIRLFTEGNLFYIWRFFIISIF